jgi:hypothetical protein
MKSSKTEYEYEYEYGYESMQLSPPNLLQSCQKHRMEKRQPFQQMLLGKVVICLQKTETRSMPVTLY